MALHTYTFIANKGRHTLPYITLIKCIHYPSENIETQWSISPSTVKKLSLQHQTALQKKISQAYSLVSFRNYLQIFACNRLVCHIGPN
jgi:hypothetical protein